MHPIPLHVGARPASADATFILLGATWRAIGGACLAACIGASCVGAERDTVPARPPARAAAGTSTASAIALGDSEPVPALLACLAGDSAVYADVRVDAETGDTVGVWISFYRVDNGIDGATVLSAAGHSDTIPFARVQLFAEDSIALDMPHAADADTSRFLGRVACDRLWGRQRNRRETPSRPALYRRVYGLELPPPG